MATPDSLLAACKAGLNIQATESAFDAVLSQKITLVQGFMSGAGVAADVLNSDAATPVIVLGVGDTWNLEGGELKFSPVFLILVGQLAAKSSLLTVTPDQQDGAADVAVTVKPRLTFNRSLSAYTVRLRLYTGFADLPAVVTLDVTQRVLTVTPSSNLAAGTKYAIIVTAAAADGPSLARTVLAFTTAQE
jgi:hypothetical protein